MKGEMKGEVQADMDHKTRVHPSHFQSNHNSQSHTASSPGIIDDYVLEHLGHLVHLAHDHTGVQERTVADAT